MFDTHDADRLSYLTVPGEYIWGYVGVYFHAPWFFVTCLNTGDEKISFHQTFMLSDVKQLLEISRRKGIEIEFVDLVSPNYMNGTNRWKMEPLKEIWLCVSEEEQGRSDHVFVLEGSVRYSDSAVSLEENASTKQLLFKI